MDHCDLKFTEFLIFVVPELVVASCIFLIFRMQDNKMCC